MNGGPWDEVGSGAKAGVKRGEMGGLWGRCINVAMGRI
jgi:hypothetical protein